LAAVGADRAGDQLALVTLHSGDDEARATIVAERDHVDANREPAGVLGHDVLGLRRAVAIHLDPAARQVLHRRRLGHGRRPHGRRLAPAARPGAPHDRDKNQQRDERAWERGH
jgi:hypothetical protein